MKLAGYLLRSQNNNILKQFLLYFHTLRYLRPIQIFTRIWYRFYRPYIRFHSIPEIRKKSGEWIIGISGKPSMIGNSRFVFLNEEGLLQNQEDWSAPDKAKLWLYNLHYFNDLIAQNAPLRKDWHREYIDRWIAENPVGKASGWEPYPISLRIINWIKWALSGNEMEANWNKSLAIQTRYLEKRIEYHLLGNHLLANAKALVFAGLYFCGDEADRWVKKGLQIWRTQLPEQILSDGGHFELSPMYHSIILEDILDLINMVTTYGMQDSFSKDVTYWKKISKQMLSWLKVMSHPDGQISFFNDAAFSIPPNYCELNNYAMSLNIHTNSEPINPVTRLPESGYIRINNNHATAILDVGKIGPDYQPGHAHADTLSFEFSLNKHRIIVNSGIFAYGNSKLRMQQRGTAAHNTVVINNENSSEVWHGFRVARRARPYGLTVRENDGGIFIECSHDGYTRLHGRPVHTRSWQCENNHMIVTDYISGHYKSAVAYLHFHPDVMVEWNNSNNKAIITNTDRDVVSVHVEQGRARLIDSTYHPEFGISLTNKALIIEIINSVGTFIISW